MANSRVWAAALVAALVVGFLAGYGLGRASLGSSAAGRTYQDGYEAAKAKLRASGLVPMNPTSLQSLSGQIKSVDGNSFVMTSTLRSINPLEELSVPEERTVTLAASAKIYRQSAIAPAELQKRMTAFQETLKTGKPSEPPPPYDVSEITLKDLKVGDSVSVEADHDILTQTSFEAVKVTSYPSPAAPTVPQP